MAASSENKKFGADCKLSTDGKNKSEKEMPDLPKIKELENVAITEKDLVAGLSTTEEVPNSSVTDKTKVTAKVGKRKIEANDEVFTAKMDSKTKIKKQILAKSMIKKSKGESLVKKNLFHCPSTAGKVTGRKVRDKSSRKAVMHPSVSVMVLESLKILKKRNGATLQQINAQIGENYQANLKMLKSHINRFLRKAEGGGVIEKVIGANAEEKFKLKKAVSATKAKQTLILKKRKVKLLRKTSA